MSFLPRTDTNCPAKGRPHIGSALQKSSTCPPYVCLLVRPSIAVRVMKCPLSNYYGDVECAAQCATRKCISALQTNVSLDPEQMRALICISHTQSDIQTVARVLRAIVLRCSREIVSRCRYEMRALHANRRRTHQTNTQPADATFVFVRAD